MPGKPKTGGKSYKKKSNNDFQTRELVYKEEGEVYGVVLRLLGCSNIQVYCLDSKKRTCHIRGKLKSRVWIRVGDVVLVSLRDFTSEDDVADVTHKYSPEEVKELRKYGEIDQDIQGILDSELESFAAGVDGSRPADAGAAEADEYASKKEEVNIDDL